MANRILSSILTSALAVLLASLIIITGVLYQYFGSVQQDQLKDELTLAASAVEQLGQGYLEALDSGRYRLTWINRDGTVLFDSHADAASMENHADREEIREALTTGAGSSSRQSATLTEQTIYEASRLSDGSVLRISVSRASALMLVLGMVPPIAVVLILAVLLSVWLAKRMAKRIVEPLNRLDLEEPMKNDAYEELSPLLYRIHSQHQEIQRQMRALKHNQEEFEQITASMKEGLVLLDSGNRILSINPSARTLFQVAATSVGENFLSVEDSQDMREALAKTNSEGHAHFRDTKGGKVYQFDLNRIDSDENRRGTVILAFDVTAQANAEKHRREFTANVSHELKTPLQSIIGSAELMKSGIVKEEDMPRFLARIHKEASRLVTLIDDIIRLSQLDAGTQLPQEHVSLLTLAQEICETLTDAARAKDVSLSVTGDTAIVFGVRRLLYEIIYNLCDNAIKYNVPNGTVTVTLQQAPGETRLCVKDTGIGIPPEHQENVFERFYRVDKSHSRQSGGTGLGLSIVKHAAQHHRASLALHSEPGRGTTICVTFPQ